MKPYYLLTVGDKVKTRLGVTGTIVKIYQGDKVALKTEDGEIYTCMIQSCKHIEN